MLRSTHYGAVKELGATQSCPPGEPSISTKREIRRPVRSVIIEAEYESDSLDEARAKMGSACCRAEVTRTDLNSNATIR
jgi:hypothetical protein